MANCKECLVEIYARLQLEANSEVEGLNEQQKAERKEELERRRYGRLWMQEGYFNEKNSGKWLEAAEILKTVNEHVLEDIEDYIYSKDSQASTWQRSPRSSMPTSTRGSRSEKRYYLKERMTNSTRQRSKK